MYTLNGPGATLSAAVERLVALDTTATLIVDRRVPLGASTFVPDRIQLMFTQGGGIDFAGVSGGLLQLQSLPSAGPWRIFRTSDDGRVRFLSHQASVRAEWWGALARLNASTVESRTNAEAFQQALDSLKEVGGTVRFSGTNWLGSAIRVWSGVGLAGDGPNNSHLVMDVRGDGSDVQIVINGGAQDVRLAAFLVQPFPPNDARIAKSGILASYGSDVEIDDVNVTGFPVGILQRPLAIPSYHYRRGRRVTTYSYTGIKGLRVCRTDLVQNLTGLEIQYSDDVYLNRVQATTLDGDMQVGFKIGLEGAPPCSTVLVEDCIIQSWRNVAKSRTRSEAIRVVNADGIRIVGCYFEPDYQAYRDPTRPEANAGWQPTLVFERNSLSGVGAEVGFNRFRDAYATGRDGSVVRVMPSEHVFCPDPKVRRLIRELRTLGSYQGDFAEPDASRWPLDGGVATSDSSHERAFPVHVGDVITNGRPGAHGSVGWACRWVNRFPAPPVLSPDAGTEWNWCRIGGMTEPNGGRWLPLRVMNDV